MKEPRARASIGGHEEWAPYSEVPNWMLRGIAEGRANPMPGEILDVDFHRRYAAILLKERGQ